MNILSEAKKQQIPLDVITSYVSDLWEEIGTLKASIESINDTFSDTKEVRNILNDLLDAYLICVGRLEGQMSKKDYIDLPKIDTKKQ